MRTLREARAAAFLLVAMAAPAAAQVAPEPALDAPGAPLWEAGLGAGGGHIADYPGADQSHWRAIALPVLIYRGPILRIDANGVRGRLLDTPQWEASLSATGAFDARSNDARAGMPALDYLAGVGPQLIYKGWRRHADAGASLHLKLRALLSTDLHRFDARGYDVATELRWRLPLGAPRGSALTFSLEPTWASGALQRYFYEVAPAEATPTRPAYAARAGYLGTQFAATLAGREAPRRGLSWFVTARAFSLAGAANEASPLLRRRLNVNVGAGLVWTPWRSAARAAD